MHKLNAPSETEGTSIAGSSPRSASMLNSLDVRSDGLIRFRHLLEAFCEAARREGVAIVPYAPDGVLQFSKLPDAQREATFWNFHRYASVLDEVIRNGRSLNEDSYVLWRMFGRLGVHPRPEVMAQIGSRDIIEIYSSDFVQVFRNLKFFAICSYTLDELICRPFWELFHRDPAVTQKLIEVASAMFSGQIRETHHWDMGTHVVDEIGGAAQYHSVIENRLASPLFDESGKVVAVLHTFRVVSCERRSNNEGKS